MASSKKESTRPDRDGFDLSGRCILFVGGRKQNIAHLRKIVESNNGSFAHHDGGMEESMNRLYSLFQRADAVLFPIDCISHAAQTEVKRLCRRWEKPYMPIRRHGVSAFSQALQQFSLSC